MEEEMAGHYIWDDSKIKFVPKDARSTYLTTIMTVEGSAERVFAKVAELLSKDSWTPMYSHMALRIANIEIDRFNVKVTLSKSHYAGD